MSATSNVIPPNVRPSPAWSPCFELNGQTAWPAEYGTYRVCMSDAAGTPLVLNRLCGADREGIIYIGRSGYLGGKTKRTLGQRLSEFYFEGPHSGGGILASEGSVPGS
jgi:hypothetical protein